MSYLLVDDEPLALARLERLLRQLGREDLILMDDPRAALLYAQSHPIEVAFLDIAMHTLDGIGLGHALKHLHPSIKIIYQSAYQEHALGAFEVGASDYLLKPYTLERLSRALDRVLPPQPLILVGRAGEVHIPYRLDQIYYIKADLSEVILRTEEGFAYHPHKISQMESLLSPHRFWRIHRSYLINLDRVESFTSIEQSKIRFSFLGIRDTLESSKEGAKHFRHYLQGVFT